MYGTWDAPANWQRDEIEFIYRSMDGSYHVEGGLAEVREGTRFQARRERKRATPTTQMAEAGEEPEEGQNQCRLGPTSAEAQRGSVKSRNNLESLLLWLQSGALS